MERYIAPRKPLGMRAINVGGAVLSGLGWRRPLLETELLLEQSIAETGLRDFGDASFREGLNQLCDALNGSAKLTQIGRLATRQALVATLNKRARLVDYYKQNKESIEAQTIRRPLIICGLPRTGTTILHEVLALDPRLRTPLSWEVAHPLPLPSGNSDDDQDPRIAATDAQLVAIDQLAPEQRLKHPMGALLPQECVSILADHFASEQYSTVYRLPSYRQWVLTGDSAEAYRWHQQFLRYLQSAPGHGDRTWLLKTPVHLLYLPTLLSCYPDAMIVQTHRLPMQVLGSLCSLLCTLRSAFSNSVYPQQVIQDETAFYALMMRRCLRYRAELPEEQFFDIRFGELQDDMVAVIERMYQHFELPISEDLKARMRAYLEKQQQQSPVKTLGDHGGRFAQRYGIEEEVVELQFREYCQRFGL